MTQGKPSKSEGTGGVLSRQFEKYLHNMYLKLTEHVRNTISLLYKQKKKKKKKKKKEKKKKKKKNWVKFPYLDLF